MHVFVRICCLGIDRSIAGRLLLLVLATVCVLIALCSWLVPTPTNISV